MTDLASLVLGIPSIIEGFVKTCRAIEAYTAVEEKHRKTMTVAIYYSRKLNYYAHFVDRSFTNKTSAGDRGRAKIAKPDDVHVDIGDPAAIARDSCQLLAELFENCLIAVNTATKVVDEWSTRLNLRPEKNGHPDQFKKRAALRISDYLSRKLRSSVQASEHAILTRFYGKTAFLVIGNQQINEAMNNLKHWLDELHDILLVSPGLRRASDLKSFIVENGDDSDDDVLFVAMARERESRSQTMETIKPEWISSLRPLDDRKPNSLMLVDAKDSPYHNCLIDRRNVAHIINGGNERQALSDTELMARLFSEEHDVHGHSISASVGILPCCGFSRPRPEHHDLVFRLPDNSRRPRTLRSILLDRKRRHALNARLEFCVKLATAVVIVHSLGIVHKDIRPDSIVIIDNTSTLLESSDCFPKLGEPYIAAFNVSRSMDSRTVPIEKSIAGLKEIRWASLYKHPRHLAGPHRPSQMRDDIYSLGICLLEIAMWRSLFIWDEKEKFYVEDKSICDLSEEHYDKMLEEMGEDVSSLAWLRHYDIVLLAEREVPVTMGNVFKDVVVECLNFGMEKRLWRK